MARSSPKNKGHGFGSAPVFLASISTILGAILFLRFGYAVGHVGIFGAFLIVLIGHAVTLPTCMAVAEIATNLKVEGGGAYYIISRSFGTTVGGAIGISLYISQAISVAFYMLAFAEAFRPLFEWINQTLGFIPDVRIISVPATFLLLFIILWKGANLGVKMLWIVVGILTISLVMFFLGKPVSAVSEISLFNTTENPDNFFIVFAIVFPAFTGMIAGIGLSGDLANPRRSIPLGTISATIVGMVVYFLVIIKLGFNASPTELGSDQFIMSRIAIWGPIIPIGLAAATLSSAIGSALIAPRTLQALAKDNVIPVKMINKLFSAGKGTANEPFNATIFTSLIALIFVLMGSVDFVARIISMFFMVTYGALCSISFLEHFAGNPSYRPTFKTRWYWSLIGAVASLIMMYQMQPFYAILAMTTMMLIYYWLKRTHQSERDLSSVIKGVLFQFSRKLQVLIQKKGADVSIADWRPSFIAISTHTLTRLAAFDILRWISHHYGFGSFIHYIKGPLNPDTHSEAGQSLEKLVDQAQMSEASIYVDTIISPSFRTAVAQLVQIPGISGLDNNSILFEYLEDEVENLDDIIDASYFAAIAKFNICILRYSKRHFGYKKKIHIWLTPGDYRHAGLMILLGYIISGHPDWRKSDIELFAAFNERELDKEISKLNDLIARGRIPISPQNVRQINLNEESEFDELVNQHSESADLVITGFSLKKAHQDGGLFFKGFKRIKDILFVRAGQKILIANSED
ncbi:amino acid permease [Gemmatimonadota bacterium]